MVRIVVPEERGTASVDCVLKEHARCPHPWDSLAWRVQRFPPSLSCKISRLAVVALMVLLMLTTLMAHCAALVEAPCPSSPWCPWCQDHAEVVSSPSVVSGVAERPPRPRPRPSWSEVAGVPLVAVGRPARSSSRSPDQLRCPRIEGHPLWPHRRIFWLHVFLTNRVSCLQGID